MLVVLLFWPALRGGLVAAPFLGLAAGLLAIFLALNRRLLLAFARHYPHFLVPAVGMTALYYLYAAVGGGLGVLLHLVDAPRSARHALRSGGDQAGPGG